MSSQYNPLEYLDEQSKKELSLLVQKFIEMHQPVQLQVNLNMESEILQTLQGLQIQQNQLHNEYRQLLLHLQELGRQVNDVASIDCGGLKAQLGIIGNEIRAIESQIGQLSSNHQLIDLLSVLKSDVDELSGKLKEFKTMDNGSHQDAQTGSDEGYETDIVNLESKQNLIFYGVVATIILVITIGLLPLLLKNDKQDNKSGGGNQVSGTSIQTNNQDNRQAADDNQSGTQQSDKSESVPKAQYDALYSDLQSVCQTVIGIENDCKSSKHKGICDKINAIQEQQCSWPTMQQTRE